MYTYTPVSYKQFLRIKRNRLVHPLIIERVTKDTSTREYYLVTKILYKKRRKDLCLYSNKH